MAALAFFYVLFSSSALGITAVLIKPMSDQLGLTIGELSASQGLRFALFGLAAPFAGGLMLRYGPRRMVAVCRLMTSSYLVGACTGRSAGLSPLRMRST
jgi:MFS family permease